MAIHMKCGTKVRAKGGRSCGGTRYFLSKWRGEDDLIKYLEIKTKPEKPPSVIELMDKYIKETNLIINKLLQRWVDEDT